MPKKPPRGYERLQQQRALGARIRAVLDELGWTQRQGAEAIGFSASSTLSNIIRGDNGIDALDLWEFARKTGYPYQYFVDPGYRLDSRWPRTKLDWKLMAGGDEKRADAHWALDQALAPK